MSAEKSWYVRSEDGKVYGPADMASLVAWAQDGRIDPSGYVSQDRHSWVPSQLLPELEMKWLVETEPGKIFGPFNRALVIKMAQDGALSPEANIYRRHELAADKDPEPVTVEKIVEKVVEKKVEVKVPVEKIVEKVVEKKVEVKVPVEKIVEKIVEKKVEVKVPVEKIVEKIVEKRVEVPVEKIVEKIVEKEVAPPPRTTLVVPEVVEVIDAPPPRRMPGGIFKDADPNRLAALEAAARRELAAAKRHGFGGLGGLFGRK